MQIRKIIVKITALLFGAYSTLSQANSTYQIKALLDNHQYKAAYELAESMESKYAGNPQFDFYYGKAALVSGHVDVAVFAFERVVMAEPSNRVAWYELALAYYFTNDYKPAEKILKKLSPYECKDKVCLASRAFIQRTQKKTRRKTYKIIGNIQLTPGYDSNVNSTTLASSVLVPFIGPVPLIGADKGLESMFTGYATDFGFLKRLNKTTQFFTDVNNVGKINYSAHRFDNNDVLISPGIIKKIGNYKLKIPIIYQQISINQRFFSETIGIGLEGSRKLNTAHEVILAGEYGKSDYFVAIRNANNALITGKWIYTPPKNPYEIEFSLYTNIGNALDTTGAYLIKDYYGAKFKVKWTGIPRYQPNLLLNYINSEFLAPNPRFLVTRKDDFYNVILGVQWECTPSLLIQPAYSYTYNTSTLPTVNYDRSVVQVNFTYKFVI
ncbi:tetratricopeptide repeat protein [Legionella hackeliae]|uniref:Uncharacterized protein n=1 Tax=Legionella hackeliae TaxID=449 RepID=A0A0A8UPV6_LEGHA|nr:tetratricopeptide repeat protein [Legionella hackeliae]KTD06662.1 Anaphase-promoting complex, cyclosome, subunit 3 [Legionella hackeliae]CEK10783.1 exported protein of unknown function [TPR repeat] [Legionella hackeliae]STX47521.1 Protein of uncharacterised function (DUF560) [Legionella hackeliae]